MCTEGSGQLLRDCSGHRVAVTTFHSQRFSASKSHEARLVEVLMFGSQEVGEDTRSHPLPGTGGGGVGEGTDGQTGPGSDSHSGSLGM